MLKQQLQQKLQQKLSPQQIQLIRLIELPAIELEERVKHELEDNPALEEGKENNNIDDNQDDIVPVENDDVDQNADFDSDISLGDYMTEDDIPEYKLREMTERDEKKENTSYSAGQS
jgi:RNA polymerase sigma-54 factor